MSIRVEFLSTRDGYNAHPIAFAGSGTLAPMTAGFQIDGQRISNLSGRGCAIILATPLIDIFAGLSLVLIDQP